jgi:hypothetical protein
MELGFIKDTEYSGRTKNIIVNYFLKYISMIYFLPPLKSLSRSIGRVRGMSPPLKRNANPQNPDMALLSLLFQLQ